MLAATIPVSSYLKAGGEVNYVAWVARRGNTYLSRVTPNRLRIDSAINTAKQDASFRPPSMGTIKPAAEVLIRKAGAHPADLDAVPPPAVEVAVHPHKAHPAPHRAVLRVPLSRRKNFAAPRRCLRNLSTCLPVGEFLS